MVSLPRKRESRSQKSYDKTGLLPRAGMTRYTIWLKCYVFFVSLLLVFLCPLCLEW